MEVLRKEMQKSITNTRKNLPADKIIEMAVNALTGGDSGRFAKGWSITGFSEAEERVALGKKAEFKTRAKRTRK
jgi:hypothetical protein